MMGLKGLSVLFSYESKNVSNYPICSFELAFFKTAVSFMGKKRSKHYNSLTRHLIGINEYKSVIYLY